MKKISSLSAILAGAAMVSGCGNMQGPGGTCQEGSRKAYFGHAGLGEIGVRLEYNGRMIYERRGIDMTRTKARDIGLMYCLFGDVPRNSF